MTVTVRAGLAASLLSVAGCVGPETYVDGKLEIVDGEGNDLSGGGSVLGGSTLTYTAHLVRREPGIEGSGASVEPAAGESAEFTVSDGSGGWHGPTDVAADSDGMARLVLVAGTGDGILHVSIEPEHGDRRASFAAVQSWAVTQYLALTFTETPLTAHAALRWMTGGPVAGAEVRFETSVGGSPQVPLVITGFDGVANCIILLSDTSASPSVTVRADHAGPVSAVAAP